MEHYQEVTVPLSESVIIYCLKCPLAEKSRWRHIWLAIKPRYLGNHASQMKSYHGTILGSQSPSFRIRHEKKPKAHPSGEITMTSYPACNKTSLSWKPCITDTKLLWNTNRKPWSLFQIPSWKFAGSARSVEITMTSYPACNVSRSSDHTTDVHYSDSMMETSRAD